MCIVPMKNFSKILCAAVYLCYYYFYNYCLLASYSSLMCQFGFLCCFVSKWQDFMDLSKQVSDEELNDRIRKLAPNKCCTLIYTVNSCSSVIL